LRVTREDIKEGEEEEEEEEGEEEESVEYDICEGGDLKNVFVSFS
jgi:hypothetical protein